MKKATRLVSTTGQVSIGREIAGQEVQVIRQDKNTWVIKRGQFIPEDEKWLHQGDNIEKINKAIIESKSQPHSDNFEEIKRRILADD